MEVMGLDGNTEVQYTMIESEETYCMTKCGPCLSDNPQFD